MSVRAQHGAIYFITFINDYTRYSHLFMISHKSKALDYFSRYLSLVENQKNGTIKLSVLTEDVSIYLRYLNNSAIKKGIKRQLMIPYTPQQNSVAERQNRTLLDMIWSMMAHANRPISFRGCFVDNNLHP